MHPSPATVAALLLLLAALSLVVLVTVAVRPGPISRTVSRHAAPGPHVPARERATPEPERRSPQRRSVRPAEAVVGAYYRALDAGRFEQAWATLGPEVRAGFGEFSSWRAGYATTLSNLPRAISVVQDGPQAGVTHELVTEDRSACGPVRRHFAVRWRLVLAADGWRATSLSAVKRSGPEPADACPGGHHPAGVVQGS